MKELNENDKYIDIIKENNKNKKFTIFYFTAKWCGPCKKLYPIINGILKKLDKNDKEKFIFYKIDIDKNDTISSKYDIKSVPTLLLINDKDIIYTVSGFNIPKITDLFKIIKNKYKDIFNK